MLTQVNQSYFFILADFISEYKKLDVAGGLDRLSAYRMSAVYLLC